MSSANTSTGIDHDAVDKLADELEEIQAEATRAHKGLRTTIAKAFVWSLNVDDVDGAYQALIQGHNAENRKSLIEPFSPDKKYLRVIDLALFKDVEDRSDNSQMVMTTHMAGCLSYLNDTLSGNERRDFNAIADVIKSKGGYVKCYKTQAAIEQGKAPEPSKDEKTALNDIAKSLYRSAKGKTVQLKSSNKPNEFVMLLGRVNSDGTIAVLNETSAPEKP